MIHFFNAIFTFMGPLARYSAHTECIRVRVYEYKSHFPTWITKKFSSSNNILRAKAHSHLKMGYKKDDLSYNPLLFFLFLFIPHDFISGHTYQVHLQVHPLTVYFNVDFAFAPKVHTVILRILPYFTLHILHSHCPDRSVYLRRLLHYWNILPGIFLRCCDKTQHHTTFMSLNVTSLNVRVSKRKNFKT